MSHGCDGHFGSGVAATVLGVVFLLLLLLVRLFFSGKSLLPSSAQLLFYRFLRGYVPRWASGFMRSSFFFLCFVARLLVLNFVLVPPTLLVLLAEVVVVRRYQLLICIAAVERNRRDNKKKTRKFSKNREIAGERRERWGQRRNVRKREQLCNLSMTSRRVFK